MKFDLTNYLPHEIHSGILGNKYDLECKPSDTYMLLSYNIPVHNAKNLTGNGFRTHSDYVRRYIGRNNETFEVLGLLQAEMGKTQNGCITFCNHKYQIIKKVMAWFEKEIEITNNDWRWYIKLNIQKPYNINYRAKVENKVINHWLSKTKIINTNRHPTTVSYITDTKNTRLRPADYGTLIIEYKNNILSQLVKKFLRDISFSIYDYEKEKIRRFMRGIIAGEGCVEIDKQYKKFRLHITANKKEERDIYEQCLSKLGIESTNYLEYKDLIISQKLNLLELLKQKLLSLSPKKYNKFLNLFKLYNNFPEYEEWKKQQIGPHNKIPDPTIKNIIKLHHQNPEAPAWKIGEQVGVSAIKVARVRKENNLGKRLVKTPKNLRKEIAEYAKQNPDLKQYEIAAHYDVHQNVVSRALRKYMIREAEAVYTAV